MVSQGLAKAASLVVLALGCGLVGAQTQELVSHSVSNEKLETILKELNISYQKNPGKKEGIYSYDFERKGIKIRLFNYSGDDLWIETDYSEKATLEEVNRWNMRAKFSRAVLVKDSGNASISLESQIDCTIGITDGMVRQFVERFDGEIQSFFNFMKK